MLVTDDGAIGDWPCDPERGLAMETPSASETPKANERPKKAWTIRKLTAPILLIAATVVAVFEFRAFFAADRAVKRLESAQDVDRKNKSPSTLTKERVQELVGKAPIALGESDGMYKTEVYIWQGLFRKYRLTAFYEGDSEPTMASFSIE
jgi:hypothetical protein